MKKNDFEEIYTIATMLFNTTHSAEMESIVAIIYSMEKGVQDVCKKHGIELQEPDKEMLFSIAMGAIKLERERILSNDLTTNK